MRYNPTKKLGLWVPRPVIKYVVPMLHPHVTWIAHEIWQEATPIEIVSHIHHKIGIACSSLGPANDCGQNPTEHPLTPMFTFDWMMFL